MGKRSMKRALRGAVLAAAVLVAGSAGVANALPVDLAPRRGKPDGSLLDALAKGSFNAADHPTGSDGRAPPPMERTPEDDAADAAWAAAHGRGGHEEQELPAEGTDALYPDDPTQPVDPRKWDTAMDGGMLEADQREMRALLNRTYEDGRPLDIDSGYVDPDTVDLEYQLLKTVTDALRAAGVRHWAERATLLGGVRQGGLLPWETSADLGAMAEDRGRASRVVAALEQLRVCALQESGLVTLYWCSGPHSTTRNPSPQKYTYPFVRLWFLAWSGDGHLAGHPAVGWPAECYHTRGEFEPLGKVAFGPLTLAGAARPAGFLERCYGKSYRTASGIRPESGQISAPPASGNGTTPESPSVGNDTNPGDGADMNVFAAQPTHSLLDMLSPAIIRQLVEEGAGKRG